MPRLGWVIAIPFLAPATLSAGQEPSAVPPPAVVEEAPPPAAGPPAAPAPQSSTAKAEAKPETENTLDRGTQVAFGIGFGGPMGAAASFRFLHGLAADVREPYQL